MNTEIFFIIEFTTFIFTLAIATRLFAKKRRWGENPKKIFKGKK